MMNEFRRVFTDGRPHPSNDWMTNEWLGYSIGFWDDDVLTIWTKGIKEGLDPPVAEWQQTRLLYNPRLFTTQH